MTNLLLVTTNEIVTYALIGGFVVIFGVMIYFQSRRRRSAQAEYTGMLDTLRPGTRVKTVGGVIGRIKEIREEAPGFKTVLLETGSDKYPSFVLYDIQAIYGVVDDEKLAAEKIAAAEIEKKTEEQPKSIEDHAPAKNGIDNSQAFQKTKKTKTK